MRGRNHIYQLGCLQIYQILLGRKTQNYIILKPTNSPNTQGQPKHNNKNQVNKPDIWGPHFFPQSK